MQINEEKILEASKLAVMEIFAEGFAMSKGDPIDKEGLTHVGKELIDLVQNAFWQGYEEGQKDSTSDSDDAVEGQNASM